MTELVRFTSQDGPPLLVEVDEDAYGVRRIARTSDGIIDATQTLNEALETAKPTIRAIVRTIQEMAPDEHEIEFGIKLNAEAGVIVAKTSLEGHFSIKLAWKRPITAPDS